MKRLLSAFTTAMLAITMGSGAFAQTLETVWCHTDGDIGDVTMRYGVALDGKYLAKTQASNTIYYWTENTYSELYASTNVENPGFGITADEAGNIILNRYSGSPSSTELIIISSEGVVTQPETLTLPSGDPKQINQIGHIVGDVLSDKGGYMFIGKNAQNKVDIIKFVNGEQDINKSIAVETPLTFTLTTIVHPIPGLTVDYIDAHLDNPTFFAMREKDAGLYVWNYTQMEPVAFEADIISPTNGFDLFKLHDKTYYVCPVKASNNSDASVQFGIFDEQGNLVVDSPVTDISPEKFASFRPAYGSISVEPNDENSVYIYRYYPEFIVAKYKFTHVDIQKPSGVDNIEAETIAPVYYNLQGNMVNPDIPGIYIRRQGEKATKIIIN